MLDWKRFNSYQPKKYVADNSGAYFQRHTETGNIDVLKRKQNNLRLTTECALSNVVQEGASANSPLKIMLAGPIIFALFLYRYLFE